MYAKRGFTLIELILAITIIGVGLAGVMLAYQNTAKGSADPLITKQMLAAAEEIMEEILLKPVAGGAFVSTPGTYNCGVPNAVRDTFDDILDYHGHNTNGICTSGGVAVPGMGGYNLTITAQLENWQGLGNNN